MCPFRFKVLLLSRISLLLVSKNFHHLPFRSDYVPCSCHSFLSGRSYRGQLIDTHRFDGLRKQYSDELEFFSPYMLSAVSFVDLSLNYTNVQ